MLRLQYPRPQHEAPICSHYEQTRAQVRGQLVVSGWAKSDGRCQLSPSLSDCFLTSFYGSFPTSLRAFFPASFCASFLSVCL